MGLRMMPLKYWWFFFFLTTLCATAVVFCLFFRLEKHRPRQLPSPPLPMRRFVRSAKADLQGKQRPEVGSENPRVVCMVVTSPQYHRDRARHLKTTWGQRGRGACPNTVFITSAYDESLKDTILSNFSRYENLWGKVLEGFMSLEISMADWFVKADDDTFLIFPHLLHLLAPLDPSKPLYLGLPLIYQPEGKRETTYMSGGAGYVLSRAALIRLRRPDAPAPCRHPGQTQFEDVNMGICMTALGVRAMDTRDSLGRARFLPYPPWRLMQPQPHPDLAWINKLSKYEFRFGVENLSDLVVSFHEIRDPVDFYLLQYLIYDLKLLSPGSFHPMASHRTTRDDPRLLS